MSKKIQEKVAELVEQGRQPVLELPPSHRIIYPKKPGRPRTRVNDDELTNHVGRRGKHWPICMAKGCYKYLKVHQRAVCSEQCYNALFNHTLHVLQKLGVTKAQLLEHYEEPVIAPPKHLLAE